MKLNREFVQSRGNVDIESLEIALVEKDFNDGKELGWESLSPIFNRHRAGPCAVNANCETW